ncbi:rhodanese-like domain-containing protein [Bradyrhizobium jicamae]|uniref:rhodanese-like domain-containing protein n=1 Tax=Bradyrhizobium jicamae TaxID=280332 RepID=UPI001BA466EB|nr:rhodanese-like domain-containing protein [Bradyrhizobium jicamae]MBR0751111.1 rhodanese-like domain-containing protein [Bradyrhizobium jicamae]
MTTEISPRQAWDLLAAQKHARLVDVRTEPEWAYVGVPDLADLGKAVAKISWHVFPEMRVNSEFIGKLRATYDTAHPVIFMCRSGGRSLAAAKAAFEAGFARCFSLAGGFEGDVDEDGHRGTKSGWKAEGLPWRQP